MLTFIQIAGKKSGQDHAITQKTLTRPDELADQSQSSELNRQAAKSLTTSKARPQESHIHRLGDNEENSHGEDTDDSASEEEQIIPSHSNRIIHKSPRGASSDASDHSSRPSQPSVKRKHGETTAETGVSSNK